MPFIGFPHWCSARTNLSTDWLLQTDAEGDTQSLINWPSRYTQTGCVSPQTLLAVQKQCFLNLLAETELPLTQSWTDWGGGDNVKTLTVKLRGSADSSSRPSHCRHFLFQLLPFITSFLHALFFFACVQFNPVVKTDYGRK